MPVYLGIIETNPNEIVLVHSNGTIGQARAVAKEYGERATLRCFAPVDMPIILPEVERLLDEHKDDDVTVNISEGTKPWAIAFTLQSRQRPNVQLLYVAQNCTFYNYTTGVKWQPETNISMEQLMRFNGQDPKSKTLLTDYDDADMNTLQKVKAFRTRAYNVFKRLTIPDKSWRRKLEGSNEGSQSLNDGSYVEWSKTDHWVHLFHNHWKRRTETTFDSPNVMHIVFNSGWFEYEVVQMVSQWSHAKEVWLDVVYPYRGGQAKNEIDIVVNTGLKLPMIECKTQIFDNTDIDKFRTSVKNYGGIGCKSLFVTESRMKDAA